MSTLNESETNQWNHILKYASLELVKIVIKHSERRAGELTETENRLKGSNSLCFSENKELAQYEKKRLGELNVTKTKKLARDNVATSRAFNTIAHNNHFNHSPADCCNNPQLARATSSSQKQHYTHTESIEQALNSRARERQPNVINLSNVNLSATELSLCSRGLSFCPTYGEFNEFQIFKDLDNFARNLRLKEYFRDQPQESRERIPNASDQSWTPNAQRNKYLDLYIELVQRDVIQSCNRQKKLHYNLTSDERTAMRTLNSRDDITIKPADKGGAIVIQNKQDYLDEGFRQLNDEYFYTELQEDPTESYTKLMKEILTSLLKNKEISTDMYKAMKPAYPKPGRFYTLPKIHKPGNPGRPIVSGIDTVTERISNFVNYLIMHLPPEVPSFIKDTNHFLHEISELILPTDSFLVTMDVTSLYTNIPHQDGIEAVVSAYKKSPPNNGVEDHVLATLIRLVLEHNNFEFEGKHFLQIRGTAMGTKMAPNYANLFMANLESRFLSNRGLKPLCYKRYIDDIFIIWPHREKDLLTFISDFNAIHPNIKFTHSYSKTNIDFLDVTIEIHGNTLSTKLYRKPTDRQQYLHFHSSHPKHCKTSIPFSQAHRFRRICSNLTDFDHNAENLKAVLTEQKYPLVIVDKAIEKARALDRSQLINQTRPSVPKNQQANLVVTYSASLPNLNNILRKHFRILQQNDKLNTLFPEPPRVVYRRGRNLKDILVQSKSSPSQTFGCQPCEKSRCQVCNHMIRTNQIKSAKSDFVFKINTTLNCDTANVIYVLRCNLCDMDYVGQTGTPFRLRFNNHKSHVNSLPHLPFSKHMNLPDHNFDAITVILLQSGFSSDRERELREAYFIHKFKSFTHGINESPGILTWLTQAT